MIRSSTAIAIVEVGPRSPDVGYMNPRRTGGYGKMTSAATVRVLKGSLPEGFDILHGKGLDDSLFQQGAGRYLVFLVSNESGFVPTDGWPSSKPIREDYVIGWTDSHSWSAKDSLENALDRIARVDKE